MDQLRIDIESFVVHGELTDQLTTEALARQAGRHIGPGVLPALGRALTESLRQAVALGDPGPVTSTDVAGRPPADSPGGEPAR
jgi:hypothetical protein